MAAGEGENIWDARRPCGVIRIECNEPKTHAESLDNSLMILILHKKFEDFISEFNHMDILASQILIAFINLLI